jgi:hypothetical protein
MWRFILHSHLNWILARTSFFWFLYIDGFCFFNLANKIILPEVSGKWDLKSIEVYSIIIYADSKFVTLYYLELLYCRGPRLLSRGQSSWLQIQRSWVWFPALPDFLRSSESETGSTQPHKYPITEELLEWKISGSGSRKSRFMGLVIRCADHTTPSICKSWH